MQGTSDPVPFGCSFGAVNTGAGFMPASVNGPALIDLDMAKQVSEMRPKLVYCVFVDFQRLCAYLCDVSTFSGAR